jgi:hypothetical protein
MLAVNVVRIGRGTRANVLASAKVELISEDGSDTVIVCDARILRNKSGELWVGFHSQTFPDAEGKIAYIPTIEFSPGLKRRISDEVLKMYEAYRFLVGASDFPEGRRDYPPAGPKPSVGSTETSMRNVQGGYLGR